MATGQSSESVPQLQLIGQANREFPCSAGPCKALQCSAEQCTQDNAVQCSAFVLSVLQFII